MRTAIRKKLLIVVALAAFIVSWLSLDLVDRNCRLHVSKLFNEAGKDTSRALATSDKRAYDTRSGMMHTVLTSLETVTEVVNSFPGIEKNRAALEGLRSSLGISRIDIIDGLQWQILVSTDKELDGAPVQVDRPAPLKDSNPDFGAFVASMGSYHPVDYVTDSHNRDLLLFYSELKRQGRVLRLGFNAVSFKSTYNAAEHELVTGSLPLGEHGGVDVVSQNGIIVNSVNKEFIGTSFAEIYPGFNFANFKAGQLIRAARRGTTSYCTFYTTQYGYIIVPFMPASEVYATRRTILQVMLSGFLIILAAIFFSTSRIVKKVILDGLERINDSLAKIEAGDLEEKVNETSYPEFCVLSQGINSTVEALKQLMENQLAYDAEQMNLARTIQLSCLPKFFPTYPELKELNLCARTSPAQEVGGDFYDYFRINDNLYCVIIADVSEHGIPAALMMMTAKTALHDAVLSGDTLEHCMESVNFSLCENNSTCMFVTAFAATINTKTGEFRFVNAGHCRPLLRRRSGIWEAVKIGSGMVLGGIDNLSYTAESWFLEDGDRVFLYTDGVTEAVNKRGEMFGLGGLEIVLNRQACDNYDPASLINLVHGELEKFTQGAALEDDITMMALEYYGRTPQARFLCVAAEDKNLEKVLNFINELLDTTELEQNYLQQIKSAMNTAADDIFTNIVSYAGMGRTETVKVTIRAEIQAYPYQLVLHFIDNGHPYDPTAVAEPDVELGYQDRRCGGLGIFLVKKLTDQMTYRYTEGCNILRLVKNLSPLPEHSKK
ncbi:MAG: SpoIIE family protein phosphatase [Candidatus Bruticola sp.]